MFAPEQANIPISSHDSELESFILILSTLEAGIYQRSPSTCPKRCHSNV
jgi:hypothetical protein